MKNNDKIIFIDLDGTLLNDQENISSLDFELINKVAKKSNWEVVFTTGRPHEFAKEKTKKFKFQKTIISFNGALIKRDEEIIFSSFLKYKLIQKMFDNDMMNKIDYAFHNEEGLFVNDLKSQFKKLDVKNIEIWTGNIKEYFSMYFDITNIDKKILKELELFFINNHINKWELFNKEFLVVYNHKINKGEAINFLKSKKIFSHTYCIGDGRNDIEAFQNVDTSFAMANSVIEVKKRATHITPADNNNSGVSSMLELIFNKV